MAVTGKHMIMRHNVAVTDRKWSGPDEGDD